MRFLEVLHMTTHTNIRMIRDSSFLNMKSKHLNISVNDLIYPFIYFLLLESKYFIVLIIT